MEAGFPNGGAEDFVAVGLACQVALTSHEHGRDLAKDLIGLNGRSISNPFGSALDTASALT